MADQSTTTILRLDSSASGQQSITRRIGDEVIKRLLHSSPDAEVIERNVYHGIEQLSQQWVQANLTPPDERTQIQKDVLSDSDKLVEELDAADIVVITAPIYNFSIPAALKMWIDMVCRARLTFRYTENGPQGMLRDRPVYLVMASGGVPFGSPVDFASDYMKHIMGFIGIQDVRNIFAERTNTDAAASERAALDMLAQWLPSPQQNKVA